MSVDGLAEWLSGLDADALEALLDRRPDAVLGHPPATLGQLAQRLAHPASLAAALRGLNAPALQALDGLLALGERRTRTALAALLAGQPGPEHERAVDAALADLAAAALAWPGQGDRAVGVDGCLLASSWSPTIARHVSKVRHGAVGVPSPPVYRGAGRPRNSFRFAR